MKTLLENYDPATGNASINGLQTFVGIGLPEYVENSANNGNSDSEAVKLAQMGYTAAQLIQLRKAGVL